MLLGASADSITLTGALTSTSVTAGGGADSILINSNVASGYLDISGAGNDTLNFSSVSAVSTTIKGGAGADVVSLYGASDVVFERSSGDAIFGGTGADTMLFTGSVVDTTINAGSGSDSIVMSGTGPSSAMTGNSIDLGVGVDTLLFTTATTNDTVTLTSTTITGAKSLTYQDTALGAAITTGAGSDKIIFQDQASGLAAISTNRGGDSIQFLKAGYVTGMVDMGVGGDSIYGADLLAGGGSISGGAGADTFLISTLSESVIYGGTAQDSINISGSLYGATVDFGEGNEQFTLTVGSTASNVQGGAGNDTFVVNTVDLMTASSIVGGAGNDSVSFGTFFPVTQFLAVLTRHPELCSWCQQQRACVW